MRSYSLAELAERIGGEVVGDAQLTIHSVATLVNAGDGQISFCSNNKYRQQLAETGASAVVVNRDNLAFCQCAAIVVQDPYLGYAKVAQALDSTPDVAAGISDKAAIADSASLGNNVKIGAFAVIEENVVLANDVQIGPHCFIGKGARIGAGTKIWANVSIYHGVQIGERCLVQANTVIGADGFGYANDKGTWVKIPQLGSVVIGNNVEIGASTTIDRGAIDDTVIEDGVIIDNQIQIAHNARIKRGAALAGCSVVAGSAVVGQHCTIGGLSAVNGHMQLADNTHYTGMSMITKSPTEPGLYSSGIPIMPNREWRKTAINIKNLNSLYDRVKALEKAQDE